MYNLIAWVWKDDLGGHFCPSCDAPKGHGHYDGCESEHAGLMRDLAAAREERYERDSILATTADRLNTALRESGCSEIIGDPYRSLAVRDGIVSLYDRGAQYRSERDAARANTDYTVSMRDAEILEYIAHNEQADAKDVSRALGMDGLETVTRAQWLMRHGYLEAADDRP